MFCRRCQNSQLQSCLLTCFSPQHRMWKVPPGGHQGWKWSRWEPLDLPIHSPHYSCRTFPTSRLCIPPAAGSKLNSSLQTDSQFTSLTCRGNNKPSAGPTPLFPCTSIKADTIFVFFTTAAMSLSSWSAVTASPAGLFLPSEWGIKKEKNIQILFFFICTDHTAKKQNKQRFITTAPRNDRRVASLSWRSVLMWAFPCFWKHLRARLTWRFSPSSGWSTLRRHRGGGAQ